MWSRNATPVETTDTPPPSSTRRTRTSVSFVLRRTSAPRTCVCTSGLINVNDARRTLNAEPKSFTFSSSFSVPSSSFLKNLCERRQKLVVLFGRADAQAEVIFEHRVAAHVADEYVAREQPAERALRLDLGTHAHEVRVRADGREALHARKVFVEPLALLDDAAHGRGKLRLVELDGDLGGGLRE